MSQKVGRKSTVPEDKDKKQTDTPVKDMKKKIAANIEKEKLATERNTEKHSDKNINKNSESTAMKSADKTTDKTEKVVEKKVDSCTPLAEKEKQESSKGEKNVKQTEVNKQEDKQKKPESKEKPKQHANKPHNGVTDVTLNANGDAEEILNGVAKVTRTPETPAPRPASDKQQQEKETPAGDESKLSKSKEDTPATDRRLRSSDSPRPTDIKKVQEKQEGSPKKIQDKDASKKVQDKSESSKIALDDVASSKKPSEKDQEVTTQPGEQESVQQSPSKQDKENNVEQSSSGDMVIEVDVELVEFEGGQGEQEGAARKPDTNYSKSRVKVSPYRRSARLADQTNTSVTANYTGNNTTMEMDITESFVSEEGSRCSSAADDSPYLSGLRLIRGRRSYKPLKEMALRHVAASRSARAAPASATTSGTEIPARPTGTVVGRKRRPSVEEGVTSGASAEEEAGRCKRARLLDRLTHSFRPRRELPFVSSPLNSPRPNSEIVGINTDLPLTAPVATPAFDPETLKASSSSAPHTPPAPRDSKRCVLM